MHLFNVITTAVHFSRWVRAKSDFLFVFGPGASGMGNYHGRWSFETFSHKRGCMMRGWGLERVNVLRYPPYTESNLSWLRWATTAKKKGWASCSVMWGLLCVWCWQIATSVPKTYALAFTNVWLQWVWSLCVWPVSQTFVFRFLIVMLFKTPPEVSIEISCFFRMLLWWERGHLLDNN